MQQFSPFNLGTVHFVGIGGIGMSGIAEIMREMGYKVQGSDIRNSANVERLRSAGIPINIGHVPENVDNVAAVVISSAVTSDNVEVQAARSKGIPVVSRANMLGEVVRLSWSVAVAGTHGKTTTTSLVAALLDSAGLDPTVINGGIVNAYDSNAKAGKGDWIVIEADESDGTIAKLSSTVSIVTNIDPEHMEFYRSEEKLHNAFDTFVENIPFYGFAVLCTDHPEVKALAERITDRKKISYGLNEDAEVRAYNITFEQNVSKFNVKIKKRDSEEIKLIVDLELPMAGEHNVQNALAAIAVADELGANEEHIRAGLKNFAGVKRRFTQVGEWEVAQNQSAVRIIDDYGHHPVEISAVLKAARSIVNDGQIIAVVQPHRFSRLKHLFEEFSTCFNDANNVIVMPVFKAGEKPIDGVNHEELASRMKLHGHTSVQTLNSFDPLAKTIAEIAQPGGIVICLGAGDISVHANELAKKLRVLSL